MKLNNKITAALMALGIVSSASAAANVVYITGSTAFRGSVFNAISSDTAHNGIFDVIPTMSIYGNATPSKGIYMLAHGNIGGQETYINCFWTGSEAGIASVAGVTSQTINDGAPLAGVPAKFLVPDVAFNAPQTNSALPTLAANNFEAITRAGDLAFSDTAQAVSLTSPTANGGANRLTEYGIVGIVPFTWYKGIVNQADAAWSRFTNIQGYQANELLGNGTRTADFFNAGVAGGINDWDHTVYLIGRNKGSGTRVNELLAAGYPVGNPVVQWQVNSVVGINPSTGLFGLYFDTTVAGYHLGAIAGSSDNGYEGGGDVAKALNLAGTGAGPNGDGNNALTVGFLGLGDAGSPSSQFLTYNGVAESDGAIEAGAYLPWGHEHVYGKHTPDNAAATALVPKLFTSIKTQLANNDSVGADHSYQGANWNNHVDPTTLHSSGIYGFYMVADRGTTAADSGYPVSLNASAIYTDYTHASQ